MWVKLEGPANIGDYVRPRNEGRDRNAQYPEPIPVHLLTGPCMLTERGPVSIWPWDVWRGVGAPPLPYASQDAHAIRTKDLDHGEEDGSEEGTKKA